MDPIFAEKKIIRVSKVMELLARFLAVMGPSYVDHCVRTAYITLKLCQEQGIDGKERDNLVFAAYFHDIGSIGKSVAYLSHPDYDAYHSVDGYLLLRYRSPLKEAAKIVLYHHCSYNRPLDDPYFRLGLKIAICDRYDDWVRNKIDHDLVIHRIHGQRGIAFDPQDVDDLLRVAARPEVVEDLSSGRYKDVLTDFFVATWEEEPITNSLLLMLSSLFELYDHTTYNHSQTVATVAYYIGRMLGYSEKDCYELFFAGVVHDFGKIFIPLSILDKPGKLTFEEYQVMKKHIVYSRQLIGGLLPQGIVDVACDHHERLDGSGYPSGLVHAQMNEPEEIMQVADVLSALLAKRSYKEEFPYEKARDILLDNVAAGKLNKHIVDCVVENHEKILEVANASIKAGYEQIARQQSKRGPLIEMIKEKRSNLADMPLSRFIPE